MDKYKKKFKNTQLYDIYDSIKNLNYKITENELNKNTHNAGFDSFITGYIYTYFYALSRGDNFFNKIYMIRSNNFNYFDIENMNEKKKNNYENMYILELKNNLDYIVLYEILIMYLPVSIESIENREVKNAFIIRVEDKEKNSNIIKSYEIFKVKNKKIVNINKYNDYFIENF